MIRTLSMSILLAAGAALWLPAQDLPGMAAGVLEQTDLARQAIAMNDTPAAIDHIHQAQTLALDIRKQVPADSNSMLIPVYTETERTITYRPVKKSKNDELTAKRLKKDTNIRDVDATTTSNKLDVAQAELHLRDADAAASQADWTRAQAALQAVSNSVVRTQVNANMPLLRARENLMLAKSRVLEDKSGAAAMPLRSAAQALADYEAVAPATRAAKAASMRQELEAYAGKVGRDRENAAQQIDYWLGPIDQWNSEDASE